MSVVPMRLLTVAGPLEQFDAVAASCVLDQEFHPENALSLMERVGHLRPFAYSNPYAAPLRRAEELLDALGLSPAYEPFDEPLDLEAISGYFDTLEQTLDTLTSRKSRQAELLEEDRSIALELEHLRGLSTQLEQLWHLDFIRFRYGYLPRETYDSFQSALNEHEELFFIPTNVEARRVYGIYFTAREGHEKVDALFTSLHFVRIHLDPAVHGTPEEAIDELTALAAKASDKLRTLEEERDAFAARECAHLRSVCSALRYHSELYDLRRYAAHSRESFYLMGWVPVDGLDAVMKALSAFPECSCVVDRADEQTASVKPPTKLRNCFLGRIFRPFLEMYGLPAYHELDPSVFLALTYCLFFGIMFGDLGQGLGLALIGLILAKWKGMWLGNIIALCGLSGALFGCVYGSVFGFEDLLPGFKILEESSLLPGSSNVLVLLLCSVGLGVCMLLLVMGLNIYNGIRQRDMEKIFFGPNGVAGILFYVGLIVAALSTLVFGVNLFVPAYVLPVLILPLVCILLREPLSLLCSGDPAWKENKLGEVLSIGLFELFETLLSYLTNTLSFLRIGAYAITHVGLMMVVHMLAGSDLNPVVIVLGNLFVMGFEGLLVGIQVLRLEFYELFGRFYEDGGIPFRPKKIQYTAHSGEE